MREQITQKQVDSAIEVLRESFTKALEMKGNGACVSLHEILGIVDEEVYELRAAIHENSLLLTLEELQDIAVAALLGICSLPHVE